MSETPTFGFLCPLAVFRRLVLENIEWFCIMVLGLFFPLILQIEHQKHHVLLPSFALQRSKHSKLLNR